MLVHRRITASSKFAGTHLYTWMERGTMGIKCLAQEHNAVHRPGLEPGPSDMSGPESSALTIRPPRHPLKKNLLLSDRLNTYQHIQMVSTRPWHSPNFGRLHMKSANSLDLQAVFFAFLSPRNKIDLASAEKKLRSKFRKLFE